ncbi:DNA-directed RNA polymerase I subunit rpa49 [Ptychographa xylographoides]|nr:DNA-directed RNA polymerase I subunit rpa49 [Ptychographa xylographoides]
MSDKKRKHSAADSERPSKKRAQESDTIAQTVKFSILKDTGDWTPAIVTTPGLTLPTTVPLNAYTKARSQTTPRATAAGRSALTEKELLLHSSAHPRIEYTAREEPAGSADSLLKHYVGIYDPVTGSLQVVPARKLVVRGTLRASTTTKEHNDGSSEDENEAPQSRFTARTKLGEAFGTKKSQKAIRSYAENAIASPQKSSQRDASGALILDPVAAAVIESMSQNSAAAPTREELQAVIDKAKPRPKANLEATIPGDVYKLEDLVGSEALRGLKILDWQTTVGESKPVLTSSKFVSKRLVKVVTSGDVLRLKALRYLLLLLDWFACLKSGAKGVRKLPKRDDIRKIVGADVGDGMLESLRKRFAPDTTMNKWAIDNYMTHVCAITLAIEKCELDISDIRDDLKLDTKQYAQLPYSRFTNIPILPRTRLQGRHPDRDGNDQVQNFKGGAEKPQDCKVEAAFGVSAAKSSGYEEAVGGGKAGKLTRQKAQCNTMHHDEQIMRADKSSLAYMPKPLKG